MNIYGLDFTSAPSHRKPITCLHCHFDGGTLRPDFLQKITTLNEFEDFLKHRGPWIAGLDFPFGQPRQLVENLGWPLDWGEYVAQLAAMSQQAFEALFAAYRAARPSGDKHHLRLTDEKAKSISPMMLVGVPVGKMFFRGAPRLLRSEVSILPCRPSSDNRIALEAYPAIAARKWLGKRSYKNDTPQKQSHEQLLHRQELIDNLRSDSLRQYYGLRLDLDPQLATQFVGDPTGDSLDALLCAIQAAWAFAQRDCGYGIPTTADPIEGWIVDPEVLD